MTCFQQKAAANANVTAPENMTPSCDKVPGRCGAQHHVHTEEQNTLWASKRLP